MSPPPCSVVPVEATMLAIVEAELARNQIALRIRAMFDAAYAWLRTSSVKQVGHNYALYEKGAGDGLLVRVGFPVSAWFEATPSVSCFELAAGNAAHAIHVGPYGELHRTYALLEHWRQQQHLSLSGQSWEIYGDWTDDVSKLETSIYLRLQ